MTEELNPSEDFNAFLSENAETRQIADGFIIDDPKKVEWFLKKVLEKKSALNAVKANSKAMISALDADLKSFTSHFGPQLETYARNSMLDDESNIKRGDQGQFVKFIKKTFKFMFGKLSFKNNPAGFIVEDADAIANWAEQRGDAFFVTETVRKLDMKAIMDYAEVTKEQDGDLNPIPGLVYKPEHDSFSYKEGSAEAHDESA